VRRLRPLGHHASSSLSYNNTEFTNKYPIGACLNTCILLFRHYCRNRKPVLLRVMMADQQQQSSAHKYLWQGSYAQLHRTLLTTGHARRSPIACECLLVSYRRGVGVPSSEYCCRFVHQFRRIINQPHGFVQKGRLQHSK
jgi:predicted metal-binding transcription factor (methanogenesis marker protein 9)